MIESDVQEQGTENAAALQSSGNDVGLTAGGMLREAREQAGLRLPALAANLKVTVGKLEAFALDLVSFSTLALMLSSPIAIFFEFSSCASLAAWAAGCDS